MWIDPARVLQRRKIGGCLRQVLRHYDRKERFSMKALTNALGAILTVFGLLLLANGGARGQVRIQDRFANVNGLRLHYLVAGEGGPVLLLHGYAENSHMWRPLMAQL